MEEAGYRAFGIGLALLGIGIALPSTIQSFREIAKTKNKTNTRVFIASVCLIGLGIIVMSVGFCAVATG